MNLETQRLLVRSIQLSDEKPFIEMASDGSLTEIFGDCSECGKWMGDFIKEAIQLDSENNPDRISGLCHRRKGQPDGRWFRWHFFL